MVFVFHNTQPSPFSLCRRITIGVNDDTLTHLRLMRSPTHEHIFVAMTEQSKYRDPNFVYRCFKGTLAAHEDQLVDLNRRGLGIFIQANRDHMRGWRRLKKDVAEATNIFLDFDSKTLPEMPLEPTLVIRTHRGYHVWYSLYPTRDLFLWQAVVQTLASRYGADPACTAPNQLARLAGFQHLKGKPFTIAIESHSDRRYRLAELQECMSISVSGRLRETIEEGSHECPPVRLFPFALRRHILRTAAGKVRANMSRSAGLTLIRQAWHLGHFMPFALPFSLSQAALLGAAGLAADAGAKRLVREALVDGCRDAANHPPYIPEELRRQFERDDRQDEFVGWLLSDLSDGVVIRKLLSENGGWSDLFDSEEQVARAVAREMKVLGYKGKKCKRSGEFVYLWSKSTSS